MKNEIFKKILHITPHLGGGVGSVVMNWMMKDESETRHTIICLDKNNNKDWINVKDSRERVDIFDNCHVRPDFNELVTDSVKNADIVVLHWYNHPLLYDLMVNFDWPDCRMVMWNHVSGLFAPYAMPEKNIDLCDKFIFTSPVSYESDEIKNLSDNQKKKLDVIWSTVGVEDFKNLERIPHDNFVVGFTGTVDFGKLNPNFVDLCAAVKNQDIKFVVCSGDSQQHLIDEAKVKGVYDKFSFEGRVPSIVPYVAKFDVFGYPLQPQHFATCEQAIGEAMMAGAVPVVLNNPTERYIIKHMETGIVANSLEEYSQAIEYLYNNRDVLQRLSKNAKIYAEKQYDIIQTMQQWKDIFEQEMELPKKFRKWDASFAEKISPSGLYAESMGIYSKSFYDYIDARNDEQKYMASIEIKKMFDSNTMFYSKNKGSVLQYLKFFPEDKYLQEWSRLLTNKIEAKIG